jgi:basic membrane protein A and related proteins
LKKILLAILVITMVAALLVGCTPKPTPPPPGPTDPTPPPPPALKVGMVTDAGTIDDKSFNQGTWEGILKAAADFGLETRYLQPGGETTSFYLTEIGNLVDAGFNLIICPGFKFEEAIFEAQESHPNTKFVILDGYPHSGDYAPAVGPNTVSIFFTEHEAGFLGGAAAALHLQTGDVGFIGGMEIPAVQLFNWGFQQGVAYANANFNTNVTIKAENVIYQGTFWDVAAGQQLAATMYDRGVKAIFAAAGGVGVGVINEAKARASAGQEVWVVGVDVDQYGEGEYATGKSVILTSAMKGIGVAAYDMIADALADTFPGGEILTFSAENNGVGIPAENPNLDATVVEKLINLFEMMRDGSLVVAKERGNLLR